jgi:hypothetical protein
MTSKFYSNRNKWQQDSVPLLLTINNLSLTINKLLQFATNLVLLVSGSQPDLWIPRSNKSGGMLCGHGSGLQRLPVSLGW